jgi:MFS family permease
VAGSGASIGFWSLVICRMFVGVGEASFVSLASPFIGEQCMYGLALRASIGRCQVSSASVQQQSP